MSPLLWVGLFFAVLLLRMDELRPVLHWAFPGVEPVAAVHAARPRTTTATQAATRRCSLLSDAVIAADSLEFMA